MKAGVGFFGLLTIVFVVLKLIGVIDWSWWMVAMPVIIQAGLVTFLVAIKDGIVQFEGLFHRWADTGSATVAIIEAKDGNVSWWLDDVKFLEPKHPLVEVIPLHKEPRQGEFHGWYQHQDEDGGYPVALVRFDDGTVDTFPVWRVRFLELGAKEDKPIFFMGNLGALLCDRKVEGLTQTLEGVNIAYGGRYFVCETIQRSAAKLIAEALGGVWKGGDDECGCSIPYVD